MRWSIQALLGTVLVAAAPLLAAQPVKDAQWSAALKARHFAEVQRSAMQRIAAKPDDLDAHAALIRAALAANDTAQRSAALMQMDACLQRLPDVAVCHYGIGALLGAQALEEGMVKAALNAGRIRDAFIKAVELDPILYAAHSGLVQFYLVAPGLIGGGVSKAAETARAASSRLPEHAKVLQAQVAVQRKDLAEAERLLATVAVGGDEELGDDLAGAWAQVGIAHVSEQQPAKARPVFERVIKERPQYAIGHYGLARVHSDTGAWDTAIALLERSAALEGADRLPVDYRLGIALQSKGDRDKARGAFTRFVAAGRGNPKNLDDAKKRLVDLQ
jgi:tetratricopeptide (TPR) repeat protein